MTQRCLIVDELHESIFSLLEKINVEYNYQPNIDRAEIKKLLPNHQGLIIRSKTFVDEDLLSGSNLTYVARAGAGVDNLDQAYLANHKITIINAPEGNRDAVGEHAIGLILNLLHKISQGHNQVVNGTWDREGNRGTELGSLTVGIIGYGNTGSTLARKLKGFGCKVIAYDKYLQESPDDDAKLVDLNKIFKDADILSLHIPLTDETSGMVNSDYFRNFSRPILFINTSRGEIAPFQDIRRAIEEGVVISAGLDVLECEKLDNMSPTQESDFNWLRESGKVILTPHVAGWTQESYKRINEVLAEKIGAFLDHS